MDSVEKLIGELRVLTPDQLKRVAQIVRELSAASHLPAAFVVSSSVIEQAARNGWPPTLFTHVIGQIDEDFERPAQLPYEVRPAL